ncbi:transmembrane protein 59-like [Uloborus diversus]|uniref:transmembrane protein 59-like n=1 Tax=Uloborus diversus TaxID=327109 RepID=UPI00240A599F|nr:transmembrane protein 59-like [Uloborus diversus]
MGYLHFITCAIFVLLFHNSCGTLLDRFLAESTSCEVHCEKTFSSSELVKSCSEGCRLFIVISLAKNFPDANKTQHLCQSACLEAYINETTAKGCFYGCQQDTLSKYRDTSQTLHLLTPLVYVRSAYNTVVNQVKQFITTSWTVYVQEDTGKMVVLETRPKVVTSEFNHNSGQRWQEEKPDWMDCISRQSGIPRWLLVIVLFGFIIVLLWLCCAAAVTAPNHYLSSSAKKNNVGYVFLCEPDEDIKPFINLDEEAPPLPPKVTLI